MLRAIFLFMRSTLQLIYWFYFAVGLSTAGYGEYPILIDNSPPVAGHVLDGDKLGQDIDFQSSDTQICAQWIDFYDPESTIDQ